MNAAPTTSTNTSPRLTRKQKEANDYAWYKEKINHYDTESLTNDSGYGGISEYRRIKVNCDLYNNIVNVDDFAYVCTPFGSEAGELPATMVNRDISSYRIKALIGMELKRGSSYKIMAVNKEATTRKEEKETELIRNFVLEQVMMPIRQASEAKYQEQMKGGELTPKEKQDIQAQMEQEIVAKTPIEARKYMERDHQDPSEVLGHQIMEYLTKEQGIKQKFSNGWKYALLSAYEVYWVGIINEKPVMKVVNPIRFKSDNSPEIEFIEKGSWAVAEYRMTPAKAVETFRFTEEEIDSIYKDYEHYTQRKSQDSFFENKREDYEDYTNNNNTLRIVHVQFKALREIGWLDYVDNDGILQQKFLVDENYKLNKANGDVRINWEWIGETYEGYKIGTNIYKNMQPVVGQAKDLDTIYESPLSYHGAVYDNTNSQPTSPMDRMKVYQYYYNIVMYRLELLMASDKGKKILMNINAIPESSGIDIEKWQYFFESTPFMWYNPDEEGMTQQDVNTVAKTLDLSLASDIQKYIDLAEYLEQKAGKSIGVTDAVLGQTAASKSVTNNQQDLVQTSLILEPYFMLHNEVKKNVLNSLLTVAKIAYRESNLQVLNYVLDDMSKKTVNVDISLLDNTTLGLFMEDSSEVAETRDTIKNLIHAAMQTQTIDLSDVLAIIKETGTQEAEEILRASEKRKRDVVQQEQQQKQQFDAVEAQKKRDHEKEIWQHEADMIVLKEGERRKTVLDAQAMLSVGFNEDKDFDGDGELDVMEIFKNSTDANIRMMEEKRKNRELEHKINDDTIKNQLVEKQIGVQKMQKSK